jgi:hypothetical protein
MRHKSKKAKSESQLGWTPGCSSARRTWKPRQRFRLISRRAIASKIEDYGIIGDTQTVVLVSRTGSFQQVKF